MLIGLAVGLLLVEVGLRIIEKVRLGDRAAPATVNDPRLGTRVAPNMSGHDANGFRNTSVPSQADLVVLGDSQTWGVNVQAADAWPQQLQKLSRRSVYNMGVGGYGPIQYWVLTEKALSFSPKVIVVGLYLGNDLYDAYALTYANDHYVDLRSRAANELGQDTIGTRAQYYWDEEKNFHNNYGRLSPLGWSLWLREHSATGRLLNRSGFWPGATDVDYEIDKAWVRAYPDHGAICEDDNIGTVLTTAYRLTGLDLDDPRVAEGLRITKVVLSRMQQSIDAHGARLLVLLIPTKELVYAELMQSRGRLTGTYTRLVEMEQRARNQLVTWCDEKRVLCIDALPDLRNALAQGRQIYYSTTESHPNATGYKVLASKVNEALGNENP